MSPKRVCLDPAVLQVDVAAEHQYWPEKESN